MTWLFALCGLVVIANVYTMIPITGDVAQALHASIGRTVWSSSMFSIWYAVGFLVFGPLSHRFGRKQIIVSGLLLLTLTTFLAGFVHTAGQLVLLRAVQGFFAASFQPVALAYVFERFPVEKKGTAISILSTGFLMAGIAGQVISSWVTERYGWSNVFVLFGTLYGLGFFVTWIILPAGEKPNRDARFLAAWKNMIVLLRSPKLVGAYSVTFTLSLAFVGMYAAMGDYFIFTYGLAPEQVLHIRAMGMAGMLVSPFAGRLIARFGVKRVLAGGLAGAVCGLLLESGMPKVYEIAGSSVIFVAGVSVLIPTFIHLVGILGSRDRSGAAALYTFILNLGASAGPLLHPVGGFRIITLLLSGVLMVSMVISVTLRLSAEPAAEQARMK
ncbi:MFS transporter [Paenibacillus humicola]|uniref:MFS transporter n=1 Tax=Paenibacillus humicola TaxID=3110540 RepID=UPI00237B6A8E|nr:MFS transporter [Paenibacillus humicola]